MSEVAILTTSAGEMVLEFWPDVAPGHVENFKKLAKQGFYDGTCFHRVIKDFMIQGGDPQHEGRCQASHCGAPAAPATRSRRSSTTSPTSAASFRWRARTIPIPPARQFFICHGDPRFLDRQYTAFGKLIKGDDVLEKIATTPTHPGDRPVKKGEPHQRENRSGGRA